MVAVSLTLKIQYYTIMIKTNITIKGINYTVRGRTEKDIKLAIKAIKQLNKKTKEDDAI